jgi:hypothetical protein
MSRGKRIELRVVVVAGSEAIVCVLLSMQF